jgi:hypothetical protein
MVSEGQCAEVDIESLLLAAFPVSTTIEPMDLPNSSMPAAFHERVGEQDR